MDLAKLIVLLQSKTLFLARADTLGDLFEGSLTKMNHLALEEFVTKVVGLPEDRETVEGLRNMFLRTYRDMRQKTYVSCWYSGETESATMWKAYAGDGGFGVVVQSTYDKLRDSLPGPEAKNPDCAYIGCIRYLDYQSNDFISQSNTLAPYMHKRVEFEGEREVRIIRVTQEWESVTTTEAGIRIPVHLDTVIDGIRAYPGAPVWIREMLTNLVRKYGIDVNVYASQLDAIPVG